MLQQWLLMDGEMMRLKMVDTDSNWLPHDNMFSLIQLVTIIHLQYPMIIYNCEYDRYPIGLNMFDKQYHD